MTSANLLLKNIENLNTSYQSLYPLVGEDESLSEDPRDLSKRKDQLIEEANKLFEENVEEPGEELSQNLEKSLSELQKKHEDLLKRLEVKKDKISQERWKISKYFWPENQKEKILKDLKQEISHKRSHFKYKDVSFSPSQSVKDQNALFTDGFKKMNESQETFSQKTQSKHYKQYVKKTKRSLTRLLKENLSEVFQRAIFNHRKSSKSPGKALKITQNYARRLHLLDEKSLSSLKVEYDEKGSPKLNAQEIKIKTTTVKELIQENSNVLKEITFHRKSGFLKIFKIFQRIARFLFHKKAKRNLRRTLEEEFRENPSSSPEEVVRIFYLEKYLLLKDKVQIEYSEEDFFDRLIHEDIDQILHNFLLEKYGNGIEEYINQARYKLALQIIEQSQEENRPISDETRLQVQEILYKIPIESFPFEPLINEDISLSQELASFLRTLIKNRINALYAKIQEEKRRPLGDPNLLFQLCKKFISASSLAEKRNENDLFPPEEIPLQIRRREKVEKLGLKIEEGTWKPSIRGEFIQEEEDISEIRASNPYGVGAIPNGGNTCFLASALQMIAVYDSIDPNLLSDSEDVFNYDVEYYANGKFSFGREEKDQKLVKRRRELKRKLTEIVRKIQEGKTVGRWDLIKLERLIQRTRSHGEIAIGGQNCVREAFEQILAAICSPEKRKVFMSYFTEYKPGKLDDPDSGIGIVALDNESVKVAPKQAKQELSRIRKEPGIFVLSLELPDDKEVKGDSIGLDFLQENALGFQEMPDHKSINKRSMFLDDPPKILPIDIKRTGFQKDNNRAYRRGKKSQFKEEFTIEPPYASERAVYRLRSFALQTGSSGGGHYRAYVRNQKNKWISANDGHIGPADEKSFYNDLESNGTFFLYERIA